jgi:hypothetical protein
MNTISYSKTISVKYTPDVAVIGGGIAGTVAACAAAKEGLSVLLVEHFGVLGGQGTVGGVRGFDGPNSGQGAVFDEIHADLERFHAIDKPLIARKGGMTGRKYDHEILAVVLQELVLRHRVTLLLHTDFIDANTENGHINWAVLHGKSGLIGVKAKYYVDASGEADLVHTAGFETMKGRPEDGLQLPMSMNFFVRSNAFRGVQYPIPPNYFSWAPYHRHSDLPMTSIRRVGRSGKTLKVKIPCFDATDTESLTAAEIEARRKMMQVLQYYQAKGHKNWDLDYCSPKIGVREGRRIVGEYILTVEDLRAGREFPDAIAVGRYPLDAHKPDDDKRTYILPKNQLTVPPYQIPLRSLIPRNSTNLLVAGRNLSADQLAMSSARVMTTCAFMGQAAGIVLNYCSQNQCTPLEVVQNSMATIHTRLKENRCELDLAHYR